MSFKPHSEKKINVNKKDIATLDSVHNEKMREFHKNESEIIPKLQKDIETLKKKKNRNSNDLDKIQNLAKQIKKMENNKKEYFLKNSQLIFEYFETKQNIPNDKTKPKIVESFFNINKDSNKEKIKTNNIVNTYLCNVDDNFISLDNYVYNKEQCVYCKVGEMIPIDYEGIMVCNKCFKHVACLFDQEKPSYKEPPKEVSFYAYKRINHFREILAQFQAKETTQIPPKLIEDLKRQITKERIELKDLTNEMTKSMLKKLGYNKYYEHIPYIKDKLGIKPPVMSQDVEEKLCSLFLEIQRPYAMVCPDDRTNFLNYHYTIYKLCEILKQDKYLQYFPMLKDREKRIEQDEIWKKICKELDWKFIPTL
jgi:hypothetical protein